MFQGEIHQLIRDDCIMVMRFRAKEKGKFDFFKDFVVFGFLECYLGIKFFLNK